MNTESDRIDKVRDAFIYADNFKIVRANLHEFFLPIVTDFLTFQISRGQESDRLTPEEFEFTDEADGNFYFESPPYLSDDDYDYTLYEGTTLRIHQSFIEDPEGYKDSVIKADEERKAAHERRRREQEDIARTALRNQISDLQGQLERLERLDNQKGKG